MIVTPQNTGMTNIPNKVTQADEPPPYDDGVTGHAHIPEEARPFLAASPNYAIVAPATVYSYTNPYTGQEFASELPPDHPQMVCLQRGHETITSFGILGIIAAVLWFPIGIGCCLLDRRSACRRCGAVLSRGTCD